METRRIIDYEGSGSSVADGVGSLLHRSSFVDSRKTGNDQPNLIARLRTPKVTTKPAIIAVSLPAPNALPATYGIQLLQNIILRGSTHSNGTWMAVLSISGAVLFVICYMMLRRKVAQG